MYVITHNDKVLIGPHTWNAKYFNSMIEQDTEIITNITQADEANVPLDLGDGLKIRHCDHDYPALESKTQMYNGPFWTFTDTSAIHSYVVLDKPLDLVRGELKALAAETRYKKEVSGTTATVQGVTVSVDTARGSRDVFVQQFLLMVDADTTLWKFPNGWLTLTKAELGACVAAGVAHIQAAFTWEADIVGQIDAADYLHALDDIVIVEPVDERFKG